MLRLSLENNFTFFCLSKWSPVFNQDLIWIISFPPKKGPHSTLTLNEIIRKHKCRFFCHIMATIHNTMSYHFTSNLLYCISRKQANTKEDSQTRTSEEMMLYPALLYLLYKYYAHQWCFCSPQLSFLQHQGHFIINKLPNYTEKPSLKWDQYQQYLFSCNDKSMLHKNMDKNVVMEHY